MTVRKGETADATRQRQLALARWDYEGGAGPDGPQKGSTAGDSTDDVIIRRWMRNYGGADIARVCVVSDSMLR